MWVAWVAVLLGLTACNALLGIGNVRVSQEEDAGTTIESSDVHGTANDVFYTSPTTTALAPEDLSVFTLQAYVPDDSAGGFRVIDVIGNKDGSFTISSLPSGPFYLLVIAPDDPLPRFYQTTSRVVDLGVAMIGRPDARVAVQPTVSTFHLSGLDTTQNVDSFFVSSFGTGEGLELDSPIPTGVTSIDSSFDWKGRRLLDATKGDELFVVHMRLAIGDPDVSKATVVDAFATRSVTLVDGQPATVTGMLQVPNATAKLDVFMDPASFLQGLDYQSHQPVGMGLRLRSTPYGGVSLGLFTIRVIRTFRVLTGFSESLSYLDPFPADMPRSVLLVPVIEWTYGARDNQLPFSYSSTAFDRRLAPTLPDFVRMSAALGAPHAIKVAGVDTGRNTAVPFDGTHAVSVEWTAIVGVTHYTVLAMHLTDNSLTRLASFDTPSNTVTMPASLFKVGDSYILSVTAISDPTTNYASGVLRRVGFPNSMREAATARLLFATSCGNGSVDAAFEACDSSGVATATCNADCTTPVCGDGFVNTVAGELCDDVGESLICNADCTPAVCGDGKPNLARGEACDLGAQNGQAGQCCSSTCRLVPPATSCR